MGRAPDRRMLVCGRGPACPGWGVIAVRGSNAASGSRATPGVCGRVAVPPPGTARGCGWGASGVGVRGVGVKGCGVSGALLIEVPVVGWGCGCGGVWG